jgi:flavin reductase (DIM6/NTAB) family NADH-FMN oxidoreductase RutF
MNFKEIPIDNVNLNPFNIFSKDWALVTAGTEDSYNTMTIAWAGLGIIWNMDVATIYIRPHRYTLEFVDNNEYFTIAFFEEEYRKALSICGVKSGRDGDKVAEAGLTPYFTDNTTAFNEASRIIICRKIYRQEMLAECFIDKTYDDKYYPDKGHTEKDYHIMFLGEVVKILEKDS